MDVLEEYYGSQAFTLYSLFVDLPGRSALPRVIFLPFGIVVLLFATLYQGTKLVIERFKLKLVIELLPTTMGAIASLLFVPYVAFATRREYKVLLSIMLNDLRTERTEEEMEIKRQYANEGKLFVDIFTKLLILAACGMSLSGFAPRLLDLIIPLNESRPNELIFNGEIFIDQEKYFHLIYFLECCVLFLMAIVVGVSENMSVIILQHVCGMGAVIGHQLDNLTRMSNDFTALRKMDRVQLVTRRLHRCIAEHQQLLHFAVLVAAFYDVPLTFVLVATFCALTASFVQVTDTELISPKMVIFTIIQIVQLFLVSYVGQIVTDSSAEIADNAFNTEWYVCSPNVRRLLQMMIMRSSKPFVIVARNMYVLSIENFMVVIQTVTSFYMVLRKAQ